MMDDWEYEYHEGTKKEILLLPFVKPGCFESWWYSFFVPHSSV
jgi:hypothetical protein